MSRTDSVAHEVEIDLDGETSRFTLLDTAGVNRSAKRADGVPYYSSLRTSEAIRRADVSLLLLDAVEGLVGGDLKLAQEIEVAGKSCGVVINKSDLVDRDRIAEIQDGISYRMSDLKPRFVTISALTGSGVEGVLPFAAAIHRSFNLQLATHEGLMISSGRLYS